MSTIRVNIASTYEEFNLLSNEIIARNSTVLGFDTETALSHQNTDISLVQIYDGHTCYLFRISFLKTFPKSFLKLLGRDYIKVGFDVEMDAHKLRKYSELEVFGLVDIQCLMKSLKYPFSSMKDAVQHFFQYDLKKGLSHESWDEPILSEKSQNYAAMDAYFSYACYFKVLKTGPPQFPKESPEAYLEDRGTILEMLRQTQTIRHLKIQSVVNIIVNSYGGWRNRYSEEQRREYAQKVLQKLAEEGQIQMSGNMLTLDASRKDVSIEVPPSSSQRFSKATSKSELDTEQILKHLIERVTVRNMKSQSLVNILTNSYTPWKILNMNEKFEKATQAVQTLEKTGRISKNPDGSLDIFKCMWSTPTKGELTIASRAFPDVDMFENLSDSEEESEEDNLSSQILQHLNQIQTPRSALQISKQIFGPKATSKMVNPTLYSLQKDGQIRIVGNRPNSFKPLWTI